MTRTWPFEGRAEPEEPFRSPSDFVVRRPDAEAVVVRIGLNGAQLVLVDGRGRWERWVLPSVDVASAAARGLGVPVHEGSFPDQLRARMTSWQRGAGDFGRGAYVEQGRVGPVIPYPENRPRPAPPAPTEEQEDDVDVRAHPGLA